MRTLKVLAPALIILAACNEPTATETTNTDTAATVTAGDTTTQPAYDAAKDGMLVGASFAKKIADTLNVKMYELTFRPGDSASLHTHPDHAVYILQGGKLVVYMDGTKRVDMDLPTGGGLIGGPLTDATKNVGKTTIKLLVVDMYRTRGNKNIHE